MATYAHPEYLIEPESLRGMLDDPSLRVFDSTVFLTRSEKGMVAESGRATFETAHVPGAVFMDLIEALSDTSSGLGFTLPAPDALQRALRELGVNDDSRVVLYSTGSTMWATRAWWLLHYAGLEHVQVLNGGFDAWRTADGAVSDAATSYPPGNVTVRPRSQHFADKGEVLAAIGDTAVCTINTLPPPIYTGDAGMDYGRKGHITGSLNVPYDAMLSGERFKPAAELDAELTAKGMLDAGRVITYCGGGIAATVDAFACLLMGKTDVAVYDGSMSEWVRDDNLPLTEGAEPGQLT